MKTKYKKVTYELLDRTSHNIYSVKEFKSIIKARKAMDKLIQEYLKLTDLDPRIEIVMKFRRYDEQKQTITNYSIL